MARNPDDVADIPARLRRLIRLFAHLIDAQIYLDAPGPVRDVRETRLAHNAAAHHAPRNRDFLPFELVKMVADLLRHVVARKPRDFIRVLARRLQRGELVAANLQQLAERLRVLPLLFAHKLGTPFYFLSCKSLLADFEDFVVLRPGRHVDRHDVADGMAQKPRADGTLVADAAHDWVRLARADNL